MITFTQAHERAEAWVNGDVPVYERREVRVREFDLGYVVWAEDREDGPTSDGARSRLVIAREGGRTTLWPALPVDEVIRSYELAYGTPRPPEPESAAEPPKRLDLEATSFLLTPPEWLQDVADKMGIPDNRRTSEEAAEGNSAAQTPGSAPQAADSPEPTDTGSTPTPPPATPWADANADSGASAAAVSVAPPATVLAPPVSGTDAPDTPPPGSRPEARTELLPGGSALPPTRVAPAIDTPASGGPATPAPPAVPNTPPPGWNAPGGQGLAHLPPPTGPSVHATPPPGWLSAGDIADAETSKGMPPRGHTPSPPTPQRAVPGAPTPPPAAPGGYIPTQLVPSLDADSPTPPPAPGAPGTPPGVPMPPPSAAPGAPGTPPPPPPPGAGGGSHAAATVLASASDLTSGPAGRGTPPPPPPPPGVGGAPGRAAAAPPPPPPVPGTPPPAHAAATMLATPQGGPGMPPPPPPPPGAPGTPPPGAPGGYGFPQPPQGVPVVGPGYMAVLRYRAGDGSEQQIIRRSAPGTPHPEWQILHELRSLNVPPQQVLELHTELESCELPGGYCARMIRETWPQVRISHTAPYGRDHASRQQGVQHLLTHQGELAQVADGPARPRPQRVPLPNPQQVQRVPPVPLQAIGQELAQAFGPQGVFRFDQRAVARQGVPDIVAQTLVWAGLPTEFGPFFWAQAQPGRPVPTLAEIAVERGVQAAPDAASYLVMGNDFGRQLCVQYGTAHIMAVPLEAAPGAQSSHTQFVNTSLPDFVRCLALLGGMWRLRLGLTPDQAGRWTVDFQSRLAALDPAALASPDNWWSVLLEQMWDGLL
ncbi:SUKH-4 family immunity protein [Streptomyces silvisoli]|uniref:SUKH-4 family immunity protein n=1 Tax=Streptomyces silvisoli TaxID=3034235 RepID=A0ABT5ZWA1_9ACTN|nr:SUKH-4 family immunity protein [Streptomyces silvisoli]MDF3293784.1 SUKH-4 family immunity protein [Streptomyces silvisoli]